jgi:hypothetical protein
MNFRTLQGICNWLSSAKIHADSAFKHITPWGSSKACRVLFGQIVLKTQRFRRSSAKTSAINNTYDVIAGQYPFEK